MKRKIIFHHPLEIGVRQESASGLRPNLMRDGFAQAGFEIFDISGSSVKREHAFKELKNKISDGEKFEFLYSETATIPSMLTDPNHLPLRPFLDFKIMKYAKKMGIPIGLFYRDMHWRYPHYKNSASFYKRMILQIFFRFEAFLLGKVVDLLFLPSEQMAQYLPFPMKHLPHKALIPGSKLGNFLSPKSKDNLKLLYVGGIVPPSYDLAGLISQLAEIEDVEVIIACREEEWGRWSHYYLPLLGNNTHIKHLKGAELEDEYKKSHLFLNLYEPYSYRLFAFPFKVMEALGYGLPIITMGNGPDTAFIEEKDVGWKLSKVEDLKNCVYNLIKHPEMIDQASERAHKIGRQNSWEMRALEVAEYLIRH